MRLSETITHPSEPELRQRASDASNSMLDGPTPSGLEADLRHYAELFAKLRFSYVEQVTKEKFIRAIVGDPPLIVTTQENMYLEKENAAAKAELKALKLQVASMVTELEKRGRQLAQRYEQVQLDTAKLEELPSKTADIQSQVEKLQAAQDMSGSAPEMHLPLAKTLSLVERRRAQQEELTRELETLQAKVPRKQKEAARLKTEMQTLQIKLQSSTTAAAEAQRRRQAALGGVADDLEHRARWLKANEGVLSEVLNLNS